MSLPIPTTHTQPAVKKMEPLMPSMLKHVCRIGQSQLIRRQMAFSLRFGCQLDAHLLFQALDTFNAGTI